MQRDAYTSPTVNSASTEFETIEREIESAKKRRPSRKRHPKAVSELLKEANIDSQTLPLVEQIACAYDNKRYLPELRHVRQFLEQHGVDASKLRSRTAASPLVIKVLGSLSESELTGMVTGLNEPVKGDLKIIADQILGPSKNQSRTVKEMAQQSHEREGLTHTEGVIE